MSKIYSIGSSEHNEYWNSMSSDQVAIAYEQQERELEEERRKKAGKQAGKGAEAQDEGGVRGEDPHPRNSAPPQW